MAADCCRAPVGGDKKFLDSLASVLHELEARETDKLLMDLTVTTKRVLYERLISASARISRLLEITEK